jgi:glycosyltransferase involved in cell wall biosynthesis
MNLQRLTVIVPMYNEEATVRGAVERLLKTELPVALETIVVDDGSTDGSIEQISDLAEGGRIKLIRHHRNEGKGAALRTGITHATGDLVTILDADLEYDPADYRALVAAFTEHDAEVVYGTRTFGSHSAFSFWYVIGNRVISLWTSFLFNTWLSDIETCFKMAPLDTWRALELRSSGFGIEAEMTSKFLRSGARIFEVPISYQARTREKGKKLNWTDGVAALLIVLRWRLTPKRKANR